MQRGVFNLLSRIAVALVRPKNALERRYNIAHKRTRCVIERTFGVRKSRFRCHNKSGCHLMYTPVKCVNIICATVVLHNICVTRGIPMPDEPDVPDNNEGDDENRDDDDEHGQCVLSGRQTRDRLIRETVAGRANRV
ncbi:HARB1-like protein [Mya arenaria]|uniref:HARB1-like protein n=1 Tax=Mya arenaria TaxID=6604 RepID=A0ABY7DI57_MYAAR|nr:HARB1-like protein [Mya arenaria]